jgi:hypothetical protein
MTAVEKKMARDERLANAGTPNKDGGVSYFIQYRGDAPTAEEVASSVQWNRGVENQEPVRHTWGPNLDDVLLK